MAENSFVEVGFRFKKGTSHTSAAIFIDTDGFIREIVSPKASKSNNAVKYFSSDSYAFKINQQIFLKQTELRYYSPLLPEDVEDVVVPPQDKHIQLYVFNENLLGKNTEKELGYKLKAIVFVASLALRDKDPTCEVQYLRQQLHEYDEDLENYELYTFKFLASENIPAKSVLKQLSAAGKPSGRHVICGMLVNDGSGTLQLKEDIKHLSEDMDLLANATQITQRIAELGLVPSVPPTLAKDPFQHFKLRTGNHFLFTKDSVEGRVNLDFNWEFAGRSFGIDSAAIMFDRTGHPVDFVNQDKPHSIDQNMNYYFDDTLEQQYPSIANSLPSRKHAVFTINLHGISPDYDTIAFVSNVERQHPSLNFVRVSDYCVNIKDGKNHRNIAVFNPENTSQTAIVWATLSRITPSIWVFNAAGVACKAASYLETLPIIRGAGIVPFTQRHLSPSIGISIAENTTQKSERTEGNYLIKYRIEGADATSLPQPLKLYRFNKQGLVASVKHLDFQFDHIGRPKSFEPETSLSMIEEPNNNIILGVVTVPFKVRASLIFSELQLAANDVPRELFKIELCDQEQPESSLDHYVAFCLRHEADTWHLYPVQKFVNLMHSTVVDELRQRYMSDFIKRDPPRLLIPGQTLGITSEKSEKKIVVGVSRGGDESKFDNGVVQLRVYCFTYFNTTAKLIDPSIRHTSYESPTKPGHALIRWFDTKNEMPLVGESDLNQIAIHLASDLPFRSMVFKASVTSSIEAGEEFKLQEGEKVTFKLYDTENAREIARINYEHKASNQEIVFGHLARDIGTSAWSFTAATSNKVILPPPPTQLVVGVIRGRDLAPKDSNGLSDPYCKIYWAQKKVTKTPVKKKTLDPIWNFSTPITITYPLPQPAELLLSCWDKDLLSKSDSMGKVSIDSSEIYPGERWYTLEPEKEKHKQEGSDANISGEILVSIQIRGSSTTVSTH